MILSFKHKGLYEFFKTGSLKGIQAKHAQRLRDILTLLSAAEKPEDMDRPGYMLHLLNPKQERIYSVRVSGNWRVTYRFTAAGPEIVDYLDYH